MGIGGQHFWTGGEIKSSGLLVADAAVKAAPCWLMGVQLYGDGTNVVAAILYDDAAAATGTVVYKGRCAATASQLDIFPMPGVWCQNGIYLDITQVGTAGCVVYTR